MYRVLWCVSSSIRNWRHNSEHNIAIANETAHEAKLKPFELAQCTSVATHFRADISYNKSTLKEKLAIVFCKHYPYLSQ